MSRLSSLVIVMALVVSACNGVVATPSTSSTSSTSSTTTSTVAPPSTVTTLDPTTTSTAPVSVDAPDWYWPEPQPGTAGVLGSGCTPGADTLPDGVWFGMVTDYSNDGITFDLACWIADDNEPNGYRIENENPSLRSIAVAADAEVWRIDLDFEGGLAPSIPYSDWDPEAANFIVCPGDGCLVWIN
ncbi:MAG: hypothetical protein R3258_07405, partial [Acidimicrobiia bacterium]|nr:hypothetical protein [Acidimicrobiia bacterium]